MPLPEESVKEITAYIEEQGFKWATEFIAFRRAYLAKAGIKASGELIDSLQKQVQSTVEAAALTRIEIEFATYGRYVDMKNLKPSRGGDEYLQGLVDWMQKKGLEQKFISGFLRRTKRKTLPQNILNQLAWGIAIKRNQRHKRRVWWNKPKSAAISDLYNRVAAGIPERVATEIQKAFKPK